MFSTRRKHSSQPFLPSFLWTDKRYYYLQLSIQAVAIMSLICATSEIVFGCWSLNILLKRTIHPIMEISSSKAKYVAIGFAICVLLSARIAALIFWIRSTRNENLRCYSVTSHCTFLSIFVMLGLGGLVIHFAYATFDFSSGHFRPHSQVLLAFCYIAGFDILFSCTFGLAVVLDLQSHIRREWKCDGILTADIPDTNWVRPYSSNSNAYYSPRVMNSNWDWRVRESAPVLEVYV